MRHVALLLAALAAVGAGAAEQLPALRVQREAVTVSGLSSGGYMAVQVHVAHSSTVKGAAALAAGPWYCAQGSVWTAQWSCMAPRAWWSVPPASYLANLYEAAAAAGRVDPARNLAGARAWLFSGTRDRTVAPEVVRELQRFYELAGASVVMVADRPAGHAMVTLDVGADCGATEKPFVNDCDYDAAGELLAHLLGRLQPRAARAEGRLARFDQNPYARGDARGISLAEEGFLYVPQACEGGGCRVHVAFHGCRQNAGEVGEAFVRDAGYNRWADANRLVVLYPQTVVRWWPVFNPRACWDWWGYTGAAYATRDGPQVRAVSAMLDRLGQ